MLDAAEDFDKKTVLLVQTDARFSRIYWKFLKMPLKKQPSPCSGLTLPWTGPGDMVAIEQTLDLLFHVSLF
jgi:hypothetical protein